MAELEARGYAKFIKKKSYANGEYVQYALNVKQKGRSGKPDTWANFQVTDFTDEGKSIEDGAYVTVKGYLTVSKYTKDGVEKTSLDLKANEVTVAPPREGSSPSQNRPQKAPAPGSQSFPDDDEIPF